MVQKVNSLKTSENEFAPYKTQGQMNSFKINGPSGINSQERDPGVNLSVEMKAEIGHRDYLSKL